MRRTQVEIILLIVLTVCCVWILRAGAQPAWGESPLSPVSPLDPNAGPVQQIYVPMISEPTGVGPTDVGPNLGLRRPVIQTAVQELRDDRLWASPWTWFVIGLVLFGGMAYGWLKLAQRSARVHEQS